MILIICTGDKTCYYNKEGNLDIKETADETDVSVIIVKVLICGAEDYVSVINISAEGASAAFSSLSTLFNDSTFHFS